MDKNVFISGVVIDNSKRQDSQIMTINYFDKNGEEGKFTSCIMKTTDMENYKKGVLNAINCKNWLQALHTPILEDCTRVCDEENTTVGLNSRFGFIGKSKVELYTQI